mmetsp:Transcript_43177/g.92112  ORF Transcript_43177/g.92112 Transcript_43177/m.92112 type:complete len:313 (+) Transcript_43177:53-991(+)
MPGVLTVNDGILWAQRIEKESVNARSKPSGGFSVRAAVSVPDVPAKFKPGHIDPSSKDMGTDFDPVKLGWDPQGTMTKDFRRCINSQTAGPRDRHQFPETAAQELGWIQARAGQLGNRGEPMGSKTDKGIGWIAKDGHQGVLAASVETADSGERAAAAAVAAEKARKEVRPRKSKDGNVREELGVPPFATSRPIAQFEQHSGAGRSEKKVRMRKDTESGSVRTGHSKASASQASQASRHRSSSLPSLSSDPSRRFRHREEALDASLERVRHYMNRHQNNKWYHPLSNSDVATFADEYSKCWGVQLYASGGHA